MTQLVVATALMDQAITTAYPPVRGSLFDWPQLAQCKGHANLFFGRRAERPQARVRREVKAHSLCVICPVQQQCRAFARDNHEYGYWGDENEETRHTAGFALSSPIGVHVITTRSH